METEQLYTVSTSKFAYNRADNKFTAKISDFGCRGIDSTCALFFKKLKSGCGFVLVSAVTGKRVVMRLVKTNRIPSDWHSEDFDVTSWVFRPVDIRQNFELKLINE